MKRSILSLLNVLMLFYLHAQEVKDKTIVVTNLSLQSGIFFNTFEFDLHDMRQLAPESFNLQQDLTGFQDGCCYYYNDNPMISIGLGFKSKEQVKNLRNAPSWFIGLNYLKLRINGPYKFHTTETVLDTLYSDVTGLRIIIDSIFVKNLYTYHNQEHLQLQAGVRYSTDQNRWISFSGGITAAAGMSFRAETHVDYFSNSNLRYYDVTPADGQSYTRYLGFNSTPGTYESHRNKNAGIFQVGIPLGMQLRLSKRIDLLKNTSVGWEWQPILSWLVMDKIENQISIASSFQIGLQVSLEH